MKGNDKKVVGEMVCLNLKKQIWPKMFTLHLVKHPTPILIRKLPQTLEITDVNR